MLPQNRVSRRDRAQPQDTSRVRTGSALLAAALVTGALLMAPDSLSKAPRSVSTITRKRPVECGDQAVRSPQFCASSPLE